MRNLYLLDPHTWVSSVPPATIEKLLLRLVADGGGKTGG